MAEMIGSGSVKIGKKEVVESMHADLTGGRELDLTGIDTATEYPEEVVPEGTPIILDAGAYKPLLEANLATDGPKVIGILFNEVKVTEPYASICIKGVVNEPKLPFAIDQALKDALNGIVFI